MSDPITMAKTAREGLAQALAALQTDINVPSDLLAAAEPVSQAMGALFQIERSQGAALPEQGPLALEAVRRALALLQAQPQSHAAVGRAMEAVAGSLGLVHGLSRLVAEAPRAAPPAPAQAPPVMHAPQPLPVHPAPAPVAAPAPSPEQAAPAPWPTPSDTDAVEVALAAHSASNFYRGLAGDDVVDHGGLFVATYKLLPIGRTVALRILFPGGYEVEALGAVRFTREAGDSSGDMTHPGYGVRLTRMTNEGRQLVARYVRNREPIFYDDL